MCLLNAKIEQSQGLDTAVYKTLFFSFLGFILTNIHNFAEMWEYKSEEKKIIKTIGLI